AHLTQLALSQVPDLFAVRRLLSEQHALGGHLVDVGRAARHHPAMVVCVCAGAAQLADNARASSAAPPRTRCVSLIAGPRSSPSAVSRIRPASPRPWSTPRGVRPPAWPIPSSRSRRRPTPTAPPWRCCRHRCGGRRPPPGLRPLLSP